MCEADWRFCDSLISDKDDSDEVGESGAVWVLVLNPIATEVAGVVSLVSFAGPLDSCRLGFESLDCSEESDEKAEPGALRLMP